MSERPTTLPELQAAASVGQGKLIGAYDECLQSKGYHAGQVLLTREDFDDRQRYLNARNTLRALLRLGAVPVINENDTIRIDEITFSDNDVLSVLVASLVKADALIMLSTIPGLCDGEDVLDVVPEINDEARRLVSGATSSGGVGGMESKLEAAYMACRAGIPTVIADGREEHVIRRIVGGEKLGTLFLAAEEKLSSRKGWIGMAAKPKGTIAIDAGAVRAVRERGKSLLASGIVQVDGEFRKGDVVGITGDGSEVARGLTNYSSDELQRIKGLKSNQIAKALGSKPYDEVVHRDNMLLL